MDYIYQNGDFPQSDLIHNSILNFLAKRIKESEEWIKEREEDLEEIKTTGKSKSGWDEGFLLGNLRDLRITLNYLVKVNRRA